jgi:hypothetical protein
MPKDMNFRAAILRTVYCLLIIVGSVSCTSLYSGFTSWDSRNGIDLYENGHWVLHYQKESKTPDGKMFFNNYIHPLYSIDGDTLTEEFPVDHQHHRGIFWAWHQIYIKGINIGDAWVRDSISQEVKDLKTKINTSSAEVILNVLWKSSLYEKSKPFVQENTTIIVKALQNEMRIIDFQIALKALTPGVSIGGSDDEKGYGGFCVRIKNPKALSFYSESGPVKAEINQIKAGPWMDITAPFGKHGEIEGITILCHKSTPNYPASWILRDSDPSMQNIVFPGRQRIEVPTDKPLVLRYRLIIHKGKISAEEMSKLQTEYNNIY